MGSVIRRSSQGQNQVVKATPGLLSQTEMRTFVIKQTSGGEVQVFKDDANEENLLMSWKDPKPLQIASVGCMTGWGATGYWKWPEWGVQAFVADKRLNEIEEDFYAMSSWKLGATRRQS